MCKQALARAWLMVRSAAGADGVGGSGAGIKSFLQQKRMTGLNACVGQRRCDCVLSMQTMSCCTLCMQAPAAERPAGRPRQAQTGLAAAAPGLQNQTGEYNCFLNVVVQCLWHCVAFRNGFLALGDDHLQARPPPVLQSFPVYNCKHSPAVLFRHGPRGPATVFACRLLGCLSAYISVL